MIPRAPGARGIFFFALAAIVVLTEILLVNTVTKKRDTPPCGASLFRGQNLCQVSVSPVWILNQIRVEVDV